MNLKHAAIQLLLLAVVTFGWAGPPASARDHPPNQAELSKYMIWDGDGYVPGGQGWTGPNTAGDTIAVTNVDAHNGKKCLLFHGEGAGLIGCGWNFFGYYPPDAGVDITNYKNLSFWIKVDAPPNEGPAGLTVALNCSSSRKASAAANVEDYTKNLIDGRWHEVVIPLRFLYTKDFDPKTTWELNVSTFNPDARRFDIYIDEIGVDNRPDGR